MRHFTQKNILRLVFVLTFTLHSFESKAAISIDSPTLLYSDGDTAKAGKMAKRGTDVMYLINAAAIGTIAIKEDKTGLLQYGETMIASQLITEAGKRVTRRERPDHSDNKSLPSGHASGSFAPAAFMYYRYGSAYGIPAFVAASFVAYTRVEARKHYVSDVAVGAAVGVLSAKYFTTKLGKTDIMIAPTADSHSIGLEVATKF